MDSEHIPPTLSEEVATIEYVSPSFEIHTFVENVCETDVNFQIIKMDNSLFIWVGSKENPTFEDLSLAMKTRYGNLPLTTKLLGASVEMVSSNFASKLVKKLGKPVYVSFNLPSDRLLLPAIEKRLNEEIKMHPDVFN